MPVAKPSIQRLYSWTLVAPPAENWAQSRNGMLYATRTGTVPLSAARWTVFFTFCWTLFGVPLVIQTAWGVSIISLIRFALALSPLEVRSAICSIAPWFGLAT